MRFRYPTIRVALLIVILVVGMFSPLWVYAQGGGTALNDSGLNSVIIQTEDLPEVLPPVVPPPAALPPTDPFTDISQTSPYFIPVKFLKNNELIKGYEDGSFQPDRLVSRAEALAMILKAAGIEPKAEITTGKNIDPQNPLKISIGRATDITIKNVTTGEETSFKKIKNLRIDVENGTAVLTMLEDDDGQPFRDVFETDWFYATVREGKAAGIVTGYEGGKYFHPKADINLAEALRMLFQATGTLTKGNDSPLAPGIDPNAWFADDIRYAIASNMLAQRPNGEIFPPQSTLNRGQLALLLYRFLQSKNGIGFGYASWYADGLAQTTITTGLEYKEQNLTAAHRTLPFGTILKVTNMNNGKETNVVINDRGPFVTGRIVDLSKSAFSALEATSAGIIFVRIEVVTPPAAAGQ